MKHLITQGFNYLFENLKTAAPLLIAGAIGAIIKRVRHGKMPLKRFLEQIVISAFLAWCLGVTLQHWLGLPNQVIYAIVSISGTVSHIILDELEEVAGNIKEWVSMLVESWIKKPKTK
jgi:hypothetical protein